VATGFSFWSLIMSRMASAGNAAPGAVRM